MRMTQPFGLALYDLPGRLISQSPQRLLRLAQPIVHAHLLEHAFGLFQVFQGLFSSARLKKEFTGSCQVGPHPL